MTVVPPLATQGRLMVTRDELAKWGERFGSAAGPPLTVTLRGDLGTGKTTLVQAICRGYGVQEPVTSPTFALVHKYAGAKSAVFHLDLYRLKDERDLSNIGWDDILSANALVLIEWPDRAGQALPPHVPIALEYAPGDDDRRILLAG